MAKQGLGLSHFHKVKEDEHSATLRHPSGHEIKVAKKALSPKLMEDLSSLPHYSSGTEDPIPNVSSDSSPFYSGETKRWEDYPQTVKDQLSATEVAKSAPVIDRSPSGIFSSNNESVFGDLSSPEPSAGSNLSPALPPGQIPVPVDQSGQVVLAPPSPVHPMHSPVKPMAPVLPMGVMGPGVTESALGAVSSGLKEEAQAQQRISEDQAKVQGERAKQFELINNKMNDLSSKYQDNWNKFSEELSRGDKDINPRHYIENMSTGKRVMSSIGLILGGLGSGLTGQPNAALGMLQRNIDADVDAQKANLGKERSLLELNMQHFGHLASAIEATKANLAQMFDAQLQQSAAQQGGALAMARAKQAGAELRLKYDPQIFSQKLRLDAMNLARGVNQQGGSYSNIDPSQLVQAIVPEHAQKDVLKEIERSQNTKTMSSHILDSFDKAAVDARPLSGGSLKNIIPGIKAASISALHQAMQPTFQDLEGTVRQAAMDNTFDNITPKLGDNDSTIKEKRAALEGYLESKKAAPTAKAYGIDLEKFSSTTTRPDSRLNEQQKKFLDWARQNPDDPKAKMVFKKLGMQ